MIDTHNKTVLVTGANSGVGFATAKRLAEAGAEIVMVCLDPRRGEEARARIADSATGAPPQLFIADLSSQEEIRDTRDHQASTRSRTRGSTRPPRAESTVRPAADLGSSQAECPPRAERMSSLSGGVRRWLGVWRVRWRARR